MSQDQENIYSQSSNSQNDIGQQTLEEIKTRSEIIIKQKCKDDFKLNNLQKDHQDFQKLIEEKNHQISEAEKDYHYLENAFGQLEITRGSVKTDVDMILKSVSEYYELFNDLEKSIHNITDDFNQNEGIIESFSKKVQNSAVNNKIEENLKELDYKRKLFKDLSESNVKLKNEKTNYLENRKMKLLNLEKEEQDFLKEWEVLQNKNEELNKEFDLKIKSKEDLQNILKIKQENYAELLQKFETDKLSKDKQIKDLELTFNGQREKITDLEKKLEELGAKRKTQNSSRETAMNEINILQRNVCELESMAEKQQQELFKYRKMIEDLRTDSSKIIDEQKKHLENLNKELNKINSSNDQIQFNIINDKKIFDDLKHEEDLKKDEINTLQNNIKDLMKTKQETEIKYTEIVNEYNIKINEIKSQKQNLMDKREKLILEKDNISRMTSDLQLKKENCLNESTQIESKQKDFIHKINEEIANLRNVLVVLEEDFKIMKNSHDIRYEEISLKFRERKNEILENTNQYKERMEKIERKAEEIFKTEKTKYLEDHTKMELQISEFNAAIENLQGELIKIIKQVNLENSTTETENPEKRVLAKAQNILKQNGPTETKLPEVKNKKKNKVEADKVFEWTTDEEEYKKSQKLKTTQSQIPRNEKAALKGQNAKKKLDMPQKKKRKLNINKISSTDSEFDWIQPSSKTSCRKTK